MVGCSLCGLFRAVDQAATAVNGGGYLCHRANVRVVGDLLSSVAVGGVKPQVRDRSTRRSTRGPPGGLRCGLVSPLRPGVSVTVGLVRTGPTSRGRGVVAGGCALSVGGPCSVLVSVDVLSRAGPRSGLGPAGCDLCSAGLCLDG